MGVESALSEFRETRVTPPSVAPADPGGRGTPVLEEGFRGQGSGSPPHPRRAHVAAHLLGWCHCLARGYHFPCGGPPGFPLRRQFINIKRESRLLGC